MQPALAHLDRVIEEVEAVYKIFKVIKRMPAQKDEDNLTTERPNQKQIRA